MRTFAIVVVVGAVVACSSKPEPSTSAPGSGSAPAPAPEPTPTPPPAVPDAAPPGPPAEGVAITPGELGRGFGSADNPATDETWRRLTTVHGFVRTVVRDDGPTTSDLRSYVVWIGDTAADQGTQVACEIHIESNSTLPPIPEGVPVVAVGIPEHGLDAPRLGRCSLTELDGKPSDIKSFGPGTREPRRPPI